MKPACSVPRHPHFFLSLIAIVGVCSIAAPVAFAQMPRPDAASRGGFDAAWQRGTPASAVGQLTVMYADDFASHRAERLYFVKDDRTGHVVQVQFEAPPPGLRTGMHVQFVGRATDSQLYVAAGQVDSSTTTSTAPAGLTAATTTGTVDPTAGQRTLAIVADFRDACVTCATGDIANTLFADPTGLSVSGLYQDNSHGQVVIGGDVAGPYQIDYASTDPCDIGAWAKAADAKAVAAGVDVANYQRRVYVMPTSSCPAAGYGTVGGSPGYAWIFGCGVKGVFAHEIGHTLGMDHAATPTSDYGDTTDPMALSENTVRGLNAPHRQQMGWLAPQSAPQVTQSGTYDLAALAATAATLPQALVLGKPDTGEFYYLSYRDAEGYDRYIDFSYYSRLSIHRYKGDGSKTYLVGGLRDGERFVDAANGITVTLAAHTTTTATAVVDLACAARAPLLSLSPASQSAAPGAGVTYAVSVTNQDGASCGAATFALAASVPAGWAGAPSPASVTLAPGATGQALFTVTSSSSTPVGSFAVSVATNDGGQPVHSASASATYAVADILPPSVPSGLTAAVDSKRKLVRLSWTPATDNVGITGYRVFRNGSLAAAVAGTAWTDYVWTAGASYTYTVVAYDSAGNVSGASNSATVTISAGGRKK